MNRDLAREAFERWYNAEYVRPIIPADRTEGGYQHPDAQSAWDAWQAALSHAEGEAVDWDDAQAVCDLPEVHDCLQCFSEDSTGDNGTEVVRAVMQATRPAPQVADGVDPWPTLIAIADALGIDPEAARKAPGKPSDVYIEAAKAKFSAPQVAVPENWREEFDQFWDAQTGGKNEWTTLERLAALDAWQHAIEWAVQHGRAPTAPAGETQKPEYGDAYQGAREDLLIWKRRALAAEAKLREQPVSDPDGLPEARGYWLKDSGYGIDDQFDTLEEALSAAFGLIEEYRIEAGADEWPSDAGSIAISTVTHVAKFVHVRENEFDLRMEAVAPAPDEREIAADAIETAIEVAIYEGRGEKRTTVANVFNSMREYAKILRAGKEDEPS